MKQVTCYVTVKVELTCDDTNLDEDEIIDTFVSNCDYNFTMAEDEYSRQIKVKNTEIVETKQVKVMATYI